jgi:NAD(P)-dependent dehydrogenase (short-subunit alcohol dehydrogenase family)
MRVQELFDLSGKTAVVTGGGSGIGRQMAGALAELGADLVVCARKLERCEAAAAELEALGVRALALRCDWWTSISPACSSARRLSAA